MITRGKILYVTDEGVETGREWFMRRDEGGRRSFRALCELDDVGLVRDVTQHATEDYYPLDCYARLDLHGETAAGWFRFGERELECQALLPGFGRISQRVPVERRIGWFGSHPLCSDAWLTAGFAHHPWGPDEISGYITSPLVTGHTGPYLHPRSNELEELALEDVEVPAGRFACRHFLLHYGETRPRRQQHVWVDEHFHCVKVTNAELASSYVLAELEEL